MIGLAETNWLFQRNHKSKKDGIWNNTDYQLLGFENGVEQEEKEVEDTRLFMTEKIDKVCEINHENIIRRVCFIKSIMRLHCISPEKSGCSELHIRMVLDLE